MEREVVMLAFIPPRRRLSTIMYEDLSGVSISSTDTEAVGRAGRILSGASFSSGVSDDYGLLVRCDRQPKSIRISMAWSLTMLHLISIAHFAHE